MKDIKVLEIKPIKEPKLSQTYEIKFKEENKIKVTEARKALEVAKILVYHKDKDAFILTKQFRPLVYINQPDNAIRYELCGGRYDKDISIEEIAKEEVLEELGYKVDKLEKITTLTTSNLMHLFYVEVDDSNKINEGGGVDYESIKVIYLPTKDAKEFMFDESKPKRPALMFCFCWWFHMREE